MSWSDRASCRPRPDPLVARRRRPARRQRCVRARTPRSPVRSRTRTSTAATPACSLIISHPLRFRDTVSSVAAGKRHGRRIQCDTCWLQRPAFTFTSKEHAAHVSSDQLFGLRKAHVCRLRNARRAGARPCAAGAALPLPRAEAGRRSFGEELGCRSVRWLPVESVRARTNVVATSERA